MTVAKIDISQSGEAIQDALERENGEPVLITRDGKAVAAVVPLEADDLESIALALDPEFLAMIEEGRRSAERDGGISFEEMKRRLGMSDD